MHFMSRVALPAALAVGAMIAEAAVVTGTYTPVTGNRWLLSLTLRNDGSPATIAGFSVYFDQALYGTLSVEASPLHWDTLVLQPDLGLASAGLFDSLADPAPALGLGQTLGGFGVGFAYLGAGRPASLPYEIYRLDGNLPIVLASGQVAVVPAALPEPGSLLLTLAALGALPAVRRRRDPAARRGVAANPNEVTA